MRKALILTLATGLGTGFSPFMPGTCGTLLAASLYMIFIIFFSVQTEYLIFFIIIICFSGVWIAGEAEKFFKVRDPKMVVIDEIAGYGITVMFFTPDLFIALSGFVLFRLFDIFKPFPVRKLEKYPAGWGIMLDDIAAGLYAALVLAVLQLFIK